MGGGGGRVEVTSSTGCSRLFGDISSSLSSFRGLQPFEPMSPASASFSSAVSESAVVRSTTTTGPFSGLVICVTGLSKEARKQVKDATERLGGRYSPNLHPQCTHLVVQSFCGRKLEHALKHGLRNGLFVVILGWFVDSVRRNVRLSESLYTVKSIGENGMPMDDLNRLSQFVGSETSCLPVAIHEHAKQSGMAVPFPEKESKRSVESTLSGHSLYIDSDISPELHRKVVKVAAAEGATFLNKWFVGCNASHVVCEGASVQKYIGHSSNLVSPLWVLKTAKEKRMQRLVHMSADMARQVGIMLDNAQNGIYGEEINGDNFPQDAPISRSNASHEERQKIVNLAKNGVRKRRCHRMQTCQTSIRPITPSSLLDSICWSISEPTSTASMYTDSFSVEDASEHHISVYFDAKGDGKESESSFVNFSRPLTESEKTELIFKNHFLTILFPVDRFAEMGPCSRTFFSNTGFTCLQVLDHVYAFYQENMSAYEIEVAIHTDSRHADRLRSVYSSKETAERGYVAFKHIDFLGSRKSFEMLKRVNGDNNSNVYELLIRA
ncbi:hypothetical protein CsSME_00048631 [Camellia sinensis var. sinensis]|uniref:uncharacterized protein LOC114263610 n=1 Tax=Camellia sinensis TaxID=4442 RepID=UPI0010355344|nr:uncharacterized protein LOC114263610 [Camellia sinensis]XP_028059979.1 uncharacterized protein LOC114263610 [Camellia sinensis]